MKFYDAKKTVYNIQGHTVKHIPLKKNFEDFEVFHQVFLEYMCTNLA